MSRVLNKRIVVFCTLFFVLGIVLRYYFELPLQYAVLLYTMIFVAAYEVSYLLHAKIWLAFAAAFLCGGILFGCAAQTPLIPVETGETYRIEGRVCDYPSVGEENTRYILEDVVIYKDDQAYSYDARVVLNTPDSQWFYGDVLAFRARVTRTQEARVPGGYNEKLYLSSLRAGMSLYAETTRRVDTVWTPYSIFMQSRRALEENIDRVFSQNTAPIAKAMLLGIKYDIDDTVREGFSRAGTAHILAITGLHIGIIAMLLSACFKRIRLPRKLRYCLNIVLLWAFCLLTGLPASVVRAAVMASLVLTARMCFAERDSLTFMCIAMMTSLVISPAQLFFPGFLLSYAAVFGILCLHPLFARAMQRSKRTESNKLLVSVSVSISASLPTLPITAYYYQTISWLSPITNLIAVPAAGLIVLATGLASVVCFVSVPAAKLIAIVGEVLISGIGFLNRVMTANGFGYAAVYQFPAWLCVAGVAVIFLCSDYVMMPLKKKLRMICCIGAACLCVFAAGRVENARVTLTVPDVGYAHACCIQTQDTTALITDFDKYGAYALNAYMKSNGIAADTLFLSESSENAFLQAERAIGEGRITRRVVCCAPQQDFLDFCKKADIEVQIASKYDRIFVDKHCSVRVSEDAREKLSFTVLYDSQPLLLYAAHTARQLAGMEQTAPVLLLNGAGEQRMLTSALLEQVNPQTVIICAVQDSAYGEPDAQTLALLERSGTEYLRTDKNATCTISYDRDGIVRVNPMKS